MNKTIAQKLEALEKLQKIDSKIDDIKKIRGALPDEIQDLEDEIIGYTHRIEKQTEEKNAIQEGVVNNTEAIKNANVLIKKYEEQQMSVRNNREYDAITKEIELQQLEVKILEKRIKESEALLETKEEEVQLTKDLLKEREADSIRKKDELDVIIEESEEDQKKMNKSRDKACKSVDDRLLNSYNKIRKNMRNGLAVVTVKRGACGGCFNVVPPQKQAEIREKKKLIVCEHCGRIFSDVEEEIEVEVKPKKRVTRRKKAAK